MCMTSGNDIVTRYVDTVNMRTGSVAYALQYEVTNRI